MWEQNIVLRYGSTVGTYQKDIFIVFDNFYYVFLFTLISVQ